MRRRPPDSKRSQRGPLPGENARRDPPTPHTQLLARQLAADRRQRSAHAARGLTALGRATRLAIPTACGMRQHAQSVDEITCLPVRQPPTRGRRRGSDLSRGIVTAVTGSRSLVGWLPGRTLSNMALDRSPSQPRTDLVGTRWQGEQRCTRDWIRGPQLAAARIFSGAAASPRQGPLSRGPGLNPVPTMAHACFHPTACTGSGCASGASRRCACLGRQLSVTRVAKRRRRQNCSASAAASSI